MVAVHCRKCSPKVSLFHDRCGLVYNYGTTYPWIRVVIKRKHMTIRAVSIYIDLYILIWIYIYIDIYLY